MKKYFYSGAILTIMLIACLLGYGIHLNRSGENRIAERVKGLRLPLVGVEAEMRDISPCIVMDLVNLYSDEMTDVVALENGRITQVFAEKNSRVEVDAPILALQDEELPLKIRQAEGDILAAEAELIKARNNYRHITSPIEGQVPDADKYDEAEAAYKATQARLNNCEIKRDQLLMQQNRQIVTSPIAGEVLLIYQKPGSYVTTGTAVALVGNFDRLMFTAPVSDKQARHMKVGREIEISFAGNEATQKSYGAQYAEGNRGGEQIFTARIVKITPPLTETASVRQVVWEVDNTVGILEPGVYSRAQMRPQVQRRCLTVPLAAVTHGTADEVAVLADDGTLAYKTVETGANDETYVEIIAGLKEGDIVITSDTAGIKAGTPIDVTLEEIEDP